LTYFHPPNFSPSLKCFFHLYLTINIFTISLIQVSYTRVYYFSINFSLVSSNFLHNNSSLEVFSFFSPQNGPVLSSQFPHNYAIGRSKAFCWNARYYECAAGMCGIVKEGFHDVRRRLPLMSSSAKADTSIPFPLHVLSFT
jgi:hypothetical protein